MARGGSVAVDGRERFPRVGKLVFSVFFLVDAIRFFSSFYLLSFLPLCLVDTAPPLSRIIKNGVQTVFDGLLCVGAFERSRGMIVSPRIT